MGYRACFVRVRVLRDVVFVIFMGLGKVALGMSLLFLYCVIVLALDNVISYKIRVGDFGDIIGLFFCPYLACSAERVVWLGMFVCFLIIFCFFVHLWFFWLCLVFTCICL